MLVSNNKSKGRMKMSRYVSKNIFYKYVEHYPTDWKLEIFNTTLDLNQVRKRIIGNLNNTIDKLIDIAWYRLI